MKINAHIQKNSQDGWEILIKDEQSHICSDAKSFFEYTKILDKKYKQEIQVIWSIDNNIEDELFEKMQEEMNKYISNMIDKKD